MSTNWEKDLIPVLLFYSLFIVPIGVFFYFVYKGYKGGSTSTGENENLKENQNVKNAPPKSAASSRKSSPRIFQENSWQFFLLCVSNGVTWAGNAILLLGIISFFHVMNSGSIDEYINTRVVILFLGCGFLFRFAKTIVNRNF